MSVHPLLKAVQHCDHNDASALNEHYLNLSNTREKYIEIRLFQIIRLQSHTSVKVFRNTHLNIKL